MSNNSSSDSDNINESDYSEADSNSESNSINSDNDDEYFIRFESTTNHEHVDYVMIGSACYDFSNDNTSSSNDNSDDEECIGCQHDVLIYFINGYVDQQMMNKDEINDICHLQGINLSSHNAFNHLLD